MCPYCGGHVFTIPVPLVKDGAEELLALGIAVPMIQQCVSCKATLAPEAFVEGARAYQVAREARAPYLVKE